MKEAELADVRTTEVRNSESSEKGLSENSTQPYLPAKEWPVEPTPVRGDRKSFYISTIYDFVLVNISMWLLLKVGFVVKAWSHDRHYKGANLQNVSSLSNILIDINGQLVTLYTILFGLIVSTLVRRYALWKAQKGAYVHELEQLQGSTSLPSTLKLIYSLKSYGRTSVCLVLIWAFYYLGSQSAKREYQRVDSDSNTEHLAGVPGIYFPSIFYPDPLADEIFAAQDGPDFDAENFFVSLDTVYGYHIATSGVSGLANPGTDVYSNPIVPDINVIKAWIADHPIVGSTPDGLDEHADGSVSLSIMSDVDQIPNVWTSLVGNKAVIYDPSPDLHSMHQGSYVQMLGEYAFPTTYLTVGCGPPTIQTWSDFPNGTLPTSMLSLNMTPISTTASKDVHGNSLRTFELWTRWLKNDRLSLYSNGSAVSVCNITSTAVDVWSYCSESGCKPSTISYRNNTSAAQATNFSTPFDNDQFAARFFNNFTLSNLFIGELTGSQSAIFNMIAQNTTTTDGLNQVAGTISPLLSKFFNTFYILSQRSRDYLPNMAVIANTYPSKADWWDPPTDDRTDGYYIGTGYWGAEYSPQFQICWSWIVLDFISCAILLTASIVSARLRLATLAPDIFGYVSSLTRDNPHFQGVLPDSGSGLGGIDRARMLRGVKVRIGDVSGDDSNVARIGLAVVNIKGAPETTNASEVDHASFLRPDMSVV